MTTPEPKPKKPPVDWASIEPHYRAGIRSVRELGEQFSVSDVAILKHAKKHEWTRDLKAKIQAKADAKVRAAAVSSSVRTANQVKENDVVEAEAELQYRVRMRQRTRLTDMADLLDKTNAHLRAMIEGNTVLLAFVEANDESEQKEGGGWKVDKKAELMKAILSFPEIVDTLKKSAEVEERFRRGEREVFGIKNDAETPGGELAEFVKQLAHKGSALPVSATVTEEE